jgi:outer membrane protein insertion porin family
LFDYKGPRGFDVNANGLFNGDACVKAGAPKAAATSIVAPVQPECVTVHDKNIVRSSVGASILWNSPLGPIRFDYAVALSKDKGTIVDYGPGIGPVKVGADQTQAFRFSGGTRF